jgi:3-oxoacyl-[acyl-carrier-protein] synthase-3
MRASVLGLGQWLPEAVRANDAWPREFGAAAHMTELTDVSAGASGDACDRIVARYVASEHGDPFLGTTRRRVADATMTACEAEALAARAALADAHIDARDVDVVLSWSLVPDHPMPASAPRVAHLVGASRALGMAADAACASSVTQLLLASALVESGQARVVLLTQSHLATRTFPFGHPASPNVGDAATAIVVGASERPGILATVGVSHGEHYDAVVWRRDKENDTPWHEAGGRMFMGSYARESARRLIQDTVRFGADTVRDAAARAGVEVAQLDVIAAVQPRRWVPGAIAEVLGLEASRAPQTFDDLAHLGGCGVVTNLIAARESARPRQGARAEGASPRQPPVLAALYAQGAGFTRAAAIVRLGA